MDEALWRAAEILRGHLPAGDARLLVLRLLAARSEPSAWAALLDRPEPATLTAALSRSEERYPALRRVFGTTPAPPPPALAALVQALSGVTAGPGEDPLGAAYEGYLGRLAREEARAGEFYTPPSVAALLAALVEPRPGDRVYDPCCGTGGLLLACGQRAGVALEAFGQELNPNTRAMALLQLVQRGWTVDLGARAADTLTEDLHPGRRAERVVANPPFNQAASAPERDLRWRWAPPDPRDATGAWVQVALSHLAPGGKAAVVLANGASLRRAERALRRALVADGRLAAVVALPEALFVSTSIAASVWVLRGAPSAGPVAMVDGRALGERWTGGQRRLSAGAVELLAAAAADPIQASSLACWVEPAELLAQGAVFSPGRWVQPAPAPSPEAPSWGPLRAKLRDAAAASAAASAALDVALAEVEASLLEAPLKR